MQDHRRLEVYQLARELALDVYEIASALPPSERFDLARQIRRAAVSIGSNIAEGCGRSTRPDFRNFLGTALGSATELEFQLDLCIGARLSDPEVATLALEKTRRVQQMLTRLIIRVGRSER
ncbi:MAG TPA: four helix bundle protein [Gemmatimonadaceae bacterium]|jgi:four helix bundle protein